MWTFTLNPLLNTTFHLYDCSVYMCPFLQKIEELSALTKEVISRQATINIGKQEWVTFYSVGKLSACNYVKFVTVCCDIKCVLNQKCEFSISSLSEFETCSTWQRCNF